MALLVGLVTTVTGCAGGHDPARADAAITAGLADGLPRMGIGVLGSFSHEGDAWTQGLALADGVLYESAGRQGRSRLREIDVASRRIRRETAAPASMGVLGGRVLGTGIAVVGSRIWQLTEHDQVAVEWDRAELRPIRTVPLPGTGRGLCRLPDGRLVASDGGDRLRLLAPDDLAPRVTVTVRVGARPLTGLGELECVAGVVWATVDRTRWLVRIDPGSGVVTGAADTSGLLALGPRGPGGEVSGIAAIPGVDGFLVTGRRWPSLYYVRVGG